MDVFLCINIYSEREWLIDTIMNIGIHWRTDTHIDTIKTIVKTYKKTHGKMKMLMMLPRKTHSSTYVEK